MKKVHPGYRIVIANQKGGCGKTTTVFNLAGALAHQGHKVLCIDLDPQGNLSKSFFYTGETNTRNIFTDQKVKPLDTNIENVQIVPADKSLSGILIDITKDIDIQFKLKDFVVRQEDYDYILIDTPPTIGGFSLTGIIAATHFIIPLSSQYYTLHGTQDLMDSLVKVKKRINPGLRFLGALMSIYDRKTAVANDVFNQVKEFFGRQIFETAISKTVAVEESQIMKKPVVQSFPRSQVSEEYTAFSKEVVARVSQ